MRALRAPAGEGLAWLSFFIIYVALPALFYRIVSQTPFAELANPRFILAAVLSTATTAALALAIALFFLRGNLAQSAIALNVGAYANVGYMGPGLSLARWGRTRRRRRRSSSPAIACCSSPWCRC